MALHWDRVARAGHPHRMALLMNRPSVSATRFPLPVPRLRVPAKLLTVSLWFLCCRLAHSRKKLGICYTPAPLKSLGHGYLHDDDFMSEQAKPLWGPRGRDDLGVIEKLGANVVRLYGNNPAHRHTAFLDHAQSLGLSVIPGLSNYPYVQMKGSCKDTGFDCYAQVKQAYLGNLQRGFLDLNSSYHIALAHIIVINEPDNVLQYNTDVPAIDSPFNFSRGVISAVDGMLAAERTIGLRGKPINFTVTTTFSRCGACTQQPGLKDVPGVGQMLELRHAFLNPEKYNYTPRNDLAAFYNTRFIHSFNTQSAAWAIKNEFLPAYERLFPQTPFYIEEFHVADIDITYDQTQAQRNELWAVQDLLSNTDLLLGWSFFEFEQSLLKKDVYEHQFGIYTLGNYSLDRVLMFGTMVDVWCLSEAAWRGVPMSKLVAESFGGAGYDLQLACVPDPHKVELTEEGFAKIYGLGDTDKMATFVARVVEHLGGNVLFRAGLVAFARRYSQDGGLRQTSSRRLGSDAFHVMVEELRQHPRWSAWSEYPACVADRQSNTAAIGLTIGELCKRMRWFDCANVPGECRHNTWQKADYVLSVNAREEKASGSARFPPCPLDMCYFNGTAVYGSASYYEYEMGNRASSCVVTDNPRTTPITEEGYQAVLDQRDAVAEAAFIVRYAKVKLGANVTDDVELDALSAPSRPPPYSLQKLRSTLMQSPWICGGVTERGCIMDPIDTPWKWFVSIGWIKDTLLVLAVSWLVGCFATCVYTAWAPDEGVEWQKKHKNYLHHVQNQTMEAARALRKLNTPEKASPSTAKVQHGLVIPT